MQCTVDIKIIVSAVQSELWKVVVSESHLSKLHEMVRTDSYRSCHLQFLKDKVVQQISEGSLPQMSPP